MNPLINLIKIHFLIKIIYKNYNLFFDKSILILINI